LATQACRRAVDLRAAQYETSSACEHAGARAIFAYEEALTHVKGKRTRATGTWQMVNRYGVIAAISKRLQSRTSEEATSALKALGMEDYSFEAVRVAYPEAFEQQLAA
jgi:hypothetical protein